MKNYTEFFDDDKSLNENYDLLAQVGYYIKDEYGKEEYDNLQDAGVIALQDGDLEINITTSSKPENTHADIITPVQRGFLSTYKKYDGLKENVKQKTELIRNFIQGIVKKYPIDLNLFYYPESPTEDVIVLTNIEVKGEKSGGTSSVVMNDLINFADNNNFIITLNPSDALGGNIKRLQKFYKRFGFIDNNDGRFSEKMIRHVKGSINESIFFSNLSGKINGYRGLTPTQGPITYKKTIQDAEYLENWYDMYLEILNSKEYNKRRHDESHGVLINRKLLKNGTCDSRVGVAIVGTCTIE